ncbi:MAG: hypothetical protein KAR17_01680 [Cyclobacteriaceae bacterium]|nr:hypothetical protein [Cyclobacteriaceae bacterium]
MKNNFQTFAGSLVIFLLLSSFVTSEEFNFTVKINKLENRNILLDGLKPSEFAELIIESKNKNIKIESFEITLARGNRAISISTIESNRYDLRQHRDHARSGDRIVIEIKKLRNKNGSLAPSNTVMVIKVN